MRTFFILFLGSLFVVSCQQEIAFDDMNLGGGGGNGGGSVPGELLVKVIAITGTDTGITEYFYNSAKQLIREKTTGKFDTVDIGNEYIFHRNASGVVTRIVTKNANMAQAGFDSLVTRVNYDNTSSRYISAVREMEVFGFSVKDSTHFRYDAGGKIVREDHYMENFISGSYELSVWFIYTYAANGDVISFKSYAPSDPAPMTTNEFTYDGKKNPLRQNFESFLLSMPQRMSANNVISFKLTDHLTPTNSFILNTTYTYHPDNKPATGIGSQTPGGKISKATFYYQ